MGSRDMVADNEESLKLFIHRGVSFCDTSLIDHNGKHLESKRWLYSKHRFRSQLENLLKPWANKIHQTYLFDEFADRLSGLRIGGSVAAVFPPGLQEITSQIQSSPIHSESTVLVQPENWDENWLNQQLDRLKSGGIKRISWHCSVPDSILSFFATHGFENFKLNDEHLYQLPQWRRNLLNASCSGPVLELTEEVQTVLTTLLSPSKILWMDEDLVARESTNNRYGLTSSWTHLVYLWAQHHYSNISEVFVLDWDGCFVIGSPQVERWTPWGEVSCPTALPSVHLLKTQPTQTLSQNQFEEWEWSGRADQYEPGPVCLGRGLKPTVIDLLVSPEILKSHFDLKDVPLEKLDRQMSSLFGLKSSSAVDAIKSQLKSKALQSWASEIFERATSDEILILGPFVEDLIPQLKGAAFNKIHIKNSLPTLYELHEVKAW